MKKVDFFPDDFRHEISSTDCTGLIPTPPNSKSEMKSYKDIVDYKPTTLPKKND